jgi:hypothetical protein
VNLRDVFFQYTVTVDIDPAIADLATDEQIHSKAAEELTEEIGEAAKWFEVALVEDGLATFELRVGTHHMEDVDDETAREEAEEWANKMFKSVDTTLRVDDIRYTGTETPDSILPQDEPREDTPTETNTDTDSDMDNGIDNDNNNTHTESNGDSESTDDNLLTAAMGGD